MIDNIHDQNATLRDLINFAENAKGIAEDLRADNIRPELLEAKNEEYRDYLMEILKIADEIRQFDVVAMA